MEENQNNLTTDPIEKELDNYAQVTKEQATQEPQLLKEEEPKSKKSKTVLYVVLAIIIILGIAVAITLL